MFEHKRAYPCAVAAGPEHGDRGLEDAIRWVMARTQELGGQPLAYVPGMSQVDDVPLLGRFTKLPGVAVGTWRGIKSWQGGPVLAAWPSRDKLGEIVDDRRTRALVAVPWAPNEIDAWIAAVNPDRLGPAASLPVAAPGNGLSPVVVEGLKTLTRHVNHANNLAGSLDRRDAVAVLRTLHKAGYRLPPDAIYSWALANGWPSRGADRLRALAADYEAGKRPQMKGQFPFRPDILDVWRAAASED